MSKKCLSKSEKKSFFFSLVIIGFYVRYLEIKYLNVHYFHFKYLEAYNRCCLGLAIIMMMGLSTLSSFHADKVGIVHTSAASAFYFAGCANYFGQVRHQ